MKILKEKIEKTFNKQLSNHFLTRGASSPKFLGLVLASQKSRSMVAPFIFLLFVFVQVVFVLLRLSFRLEIAISLMVFSIFKSNWQLRI